MAATALRESGNVAFKAKDFSKACDLYTASMKACEGEEEEETQLAVLFSNRAACHLKISATQSGADKIDSIRSAVSDAASCLKADTTFAKGYLRANEAALASGRLETAVRFLELGLRIGPPRNIGEKLDAELAKLQLRHPPEVLYPKTRPGESKAVRKLRNLKNDWEEGQESDGEGEGEDEEEEEKDDDEEEEDDDEEDDDEEYDEESYEVRGGGGEGGYGSRCGQFKRETDLTDLLALALDDALISAESPVPVAACQALLEMKIPGISRLLVPRITRGFQTEDYNLCEARPGSDDMRAFFCSSFCADYAKQRGPHAETCLAGARHMCPFKRQPHDELEHPARCILCHRKYGHSESGEAVAEAEVISVCGPCDYKGQYCMCVECHSKIQPSGDPSVQRCPYCRLQLQGRLS